MAGKIITLPTWISAGTYKFEIDFPSDNNDKTVNGQNIECSNLKFSELKGIFANPNYSLTSMSTNININPYARFRGDSVAPHSIGAFAGYNHQAKPCSYILDLGSITVNKTYISAGVYNYTVHASVLRGERNPLYYPSNENGWSSIAVSFEIDGTRKWDTIVVDDDQQTANNYAEATFTSNVGTAETKSCTVTAYYLYQVTSSTNYDGEYAINIYNLGYPTANQYGLLIEGGAESLTVNVNAVPYANFSGQWSYTPGQHILSLTCTPSYYTYSFTNITPTGCTITQQTSSGNQINFTLNLGPDDDGVVNLDVQATYTGYNPTNQNFEATIIDDALDFTPD